MQDKILFILQGYFASSVFFAVLHKRAELSSSFFEAGLEIGKKMKFLQAKQRTYAKITLLVGN